MARSITRPSRPRCSITLVRKGLFGLLKCATAPESVASSRAVPCVRPIGPPATKRTAPGAEPAAPLVNWLQNWRISRWLMERIAGIDRRRSLPRLHMRHFRRWHARHAAAPAAGRYGRVLLLADCFTTYYEPRIGQAAVRVLERAGYTVELADLTCCCR